MKMKERMPFNLQFFAEGDPTPGEPPKTFTQEEVNGAVEAESKKAVEKLLKELGFEGEGQAKEKAGKFKEWLDTQKTDLQKANEKTGELETEKQTLVQEKAKLELQVACLKGGCKSEAIEDVSLLASKLVSETVTMEEAVKQILEKYPDFKGEGTVITGKTPPDGKSTAADKKKTSANDFIAAIKEKQSKRR